jgi:N-acetylglutamate synthase-like GNAT family acetyltransferase
MLSIRPARRPDLKAIKKILEDLDLFYPSLPMQDFWVAEKEQEIVGTLQLKKYKNFLFLRALGVTKNNRDQGIATALIKETLKSADKNTYLYTIIPDFFKRFDFKIITPPADLPSKNQYECEYCHPEKCVCMVKLSHAS